MINEGILRKVYKLRPQWSHKGNFGKLLVVGGSKKFTGAPLHVGLAALRTGCDWVTVASPQRAADICAQSPDLITIPLTGAALTTTNLRAVIDAASDHSALVIGNGLGNSPQTKKAVLKLLEKTTTPCVVDADALEAVSEKKSLVRENMILTPHAREFRGISGEKPEPDEDQRMELAKKIAKEFGCTVLLKGAIDVIASPGASEMNKTGTSFMTKAGTGDVLAGICGAFLAMGHDPYLSACAAAFLNGKTGEALESKGPGLLASDLIAEIPNQIPGVR